MLPNKTSPTWLWAYESLNRHSLMMCKVKKRQWKKLAISRGICGAHSLVKPKLISSTDDWLTHMIRMNGMNSHFETIGWWRFTRLFHVHVVTHVHIGVFTFFVNESTRFTWTSSFSLHTFFSTFAYWWPAFIGVY